MLSGPRTRRIENPSIPKNHEGGGPHTKSRKRKSLLPRDTKEDEPDPRLSKTRAAQDITNTSGVWGSGVNAGRVVDYESKVVETLPEVISTTAKIAGNSEDKSTLECRHNRMWIRLPVVAQLLTTACNVGSSMAVFLASRLAVGSLPSTSCSKYYESRIGSICYREA